MTDADMLFLNLSTRNGTPQTEQPLVLEDSRSSAVLNAPGDYVCSLVDFTLPLTTMPLRYWDRTPNSHYVTLRHLPTDTDYSSEVLYADTRNTGLTSGWVWSAQEYIDQTNAAFARAFSALLASQNAIAAGEQPSEGLEGELPPPEEEPPSEGLEGELPPPEEPPSEGLEGELPPPEEEPAPEVAPLVGAAIAASAPPQVDIENGLCSLYIQRDYMNPNEIGVFVSHQINDLFLGICSYRRSVPLLPANYAVDLRSQYEWRQELSLVGTVNLGPNGNSPATQYIKTTQVRPTASTWWLTRQLLFKVSGVNVHGELMPSGEFSTSSTASLLRKFNLTGDVQRSGGGAVYDVSGAHRWYDIRKSPPLQTMRIELFWTHDGGVLHPLTLGYGEEATCRLLFRLKGLSLA